MDVEPADMEDQLYYPVYIKNFDIYRGPGTNPHWILRDDCNFFILTILLC